MSSFISSSDPAPWRRFFFTAAGTAAACTAVIFAFVALVDPWNILPASPRLDRAPVTSSQRFAYPALAKSALFDSAIFGTSASRLLQPAVLNDLFHARFANLAMNDATPWEQARLMEVFFRAHPQAKYIILGFDQKWCATAETIPRLTPRPFPEWMYGGNPWRGYLELFNMYAVQEAGKEFGVLTGIKREDQGRDGYTVFVPPDDQYDAERAAAHLREDGPNAPGVPGEGPPATWRYPAFDELNSLLREMPSTAELIVYFVPYNRVRLPPPGHPGAAVWGECKRRTAEVAAHSGNMLVVDFMKHSPITDNDENYWDAQHSRVGVSSRVANDLAAAGRGEMSSDYDILNKAGR